MNSTNKSALLSYAVCKAKLGERASALEALNRARGLSAADADQLFKEAIVYELLHERNLALSALERCMQLGYSRSEIEHAPELRSVRSDPRFQKLAVG